MNNLACIPKIRISEVEVDLVCVYYGLPEEVSKYIQLLAFSKHLPFTMPTGIYSMSGGGIVPSDVQRHGHPMFPHGSLWIVANASRYARCIENGRIDSIRNAIKSIGGVTTGGVCDIDNFDKELPVGKLRNEVRNHIFTIEGIFRQKSSIVDQHERLSGSMYHRVYVFPMRPEKRPYKRITRKTWI